METVQKSMYVVLVKTPFMNRPTDGLVARIDPNSTVEDAVYAAVESIKGHDQVRYNDFNRTLREPYNARIGGEVVPKDTRLSDLHGLTESIEGSMDRGITIDLETVHEGGGYLKKLYEA